MQLKVASYNIHKAVGLDRRRDPERIVAVLREIDADIVALQEVDRRFGARAAVLPRPLIDDHTPYRAVPIKGRPDSLGWHGNAILVRRDIEVVEAAQVILPTLEPRGAVRADLSVAGQRVRIVGMHLDLSGLKRKSQIRAVLDHCGSCGDDCPTVLMGDCNEWTQAGSLRAFEGFKVLAPGRSFPANRPLAQLDRIVVSPHWETDRCGVHHSALAATASDHLPVWASLASPVPKI